VIVLLRKVVVFFIAIYIIVSLVHLSYMMACYDTAKPLDWVYFGVYVISGITYKIVKNY
jgi:hypothetical protein